MILRDLYGPQARCPRPPPPAQGDGGQAQKGAPFLSETHVLDKETRGGADRQGLMFKKPCVALTPGDLHVGIYTPSPTMQ